MALLKFSPTTAWVSPPSPISHFVIVMALALTATGCTTPILKNSVEAPAKYAAATTSNEEPEAAWWESYGDPVLSDLIKRAARENRDVKIAAQRVRAARAGETISRSWLFPSVTAGAASFDQRTNYSALNRQAVPDTKTSIGALDVFWEIDISGRLSAGAKASAADTIATEHGVRGIKLLVASDVASNYFMLVGALRQLESVRAISAAQDETLRLVVARERAGLATPFDVERAQTDASRARAAIPPLETLVAMSRHRIAVLIGDQAFNASNIVPGKSNIVAPVVTSGQPATLLERRPDLLALKAQLDAANSRRRQAAAEWFPRLFLNALFGREDVEMNGMSLGAARFSNVAGLLVMPIFNAGRTRSINEIAESNQSVALLRYEDGIVRALEDVENTLVAVADERRRTEQLESAAASAEAALGRAQSLYERGQIDMLPLLDAQRTRLAVRVSANDSRTQLLLDTVQLYKALGGGWQVFEPAVKPAAADEKHAPRS